MARVAVEFPSLCSTHCTPIPRRGKAPRRGRVHEHASPALASRLGRGRTLRELEITVCLSEAFQKSLRQRTLVSHPDLVVPTSGLDERFRGPPKIVLPILGSKIGIKSPCTARPHVEGGLKLTSRNRTQPLLAACQYGQQKDPATTSHEPRICPTGGENMWTATHTMDASPPMARAITEEIHGGAFPDGGRYTPWPSRYSSDP